MTENKHIGKIIYALVAIALAAVMTVSAAANRTRSSDKGSSGRYGRNTGV